MAETETEGKEGKQGRTYLRVEEKDVLSQMLPEWIAKANKKQRDAFVKSEVLPKIQSLNLDKFAPDLIEKDKAASFLWGKRIQAIYTWFKNNKPFKNKAVFKMERKLHIRSVVAKLKTDEIHEMVVRLHPEVEKGDKQYPGYFQKAVSQCIREMAPEEKKDMEVKRDEWQRAGPPIEVRLKAAKRYSRKAIVDAHQLLFEEMFVSCITFSFFPDPDDGVIGIICHDYISRLNSDMGGAAVLPFRDWNPAAHKQIVNYLIGYADYVDGQRKLDPTPKKEIPEQSLLYAAGPGGLPLLPKAVLGVKGEELAATAAKIIRAYFLEHYKLATGDNNARTPWHTIGLDPGRFFDPSCLPAGFQFQDPSRMGKTVKDLLTHLRNRQEEFGVNAFHFQNVLGKQDDLQAAKYPTTAQEAIAAGADVLRWPISAPAALAEAADDKISKPMESEKLVSIPQNEPAAETISVPETLLPNGSTSVPVDTSQPFQVPTPSPTPVHRSDGRDSESDPFLVSPPSPKSAACSMPIVKQERISPFTGEMTPSSPTPKAQNPSNLMNYWPLTMNPPAGLPEFPPYHPPRPLSALDPFANIDPLL